ncbi:MAG: ABC transporter substrate-binding protein [Dethiobacteria bacterium]|jgi:glycine betaine/proline transport system substrate-binding protein|nr:ABC transporter substrate-binding protein [Bacillota bacterium]NMD33401.1 ABC transporter substrate-binding protein [Bacillota bacterium]HOB29691.1 ABC transporter substrate-binding protein [Bacillota bacterium]HQD53167.1 ABC transporter substrate-binding protein [Bacillota bacterium]
MFNKKILIVLIVAAMLMTVSCAPMGGDELVLADAGWDSIQIHNGIASFIIENGYGYETRVLSGSTAMTFTSLREGSIDIYMETWQGNLKDSYDEGIESGDILELSVNYDDSRQGYYVPTFVIEGDPERGIEPMAPDLRRVDQLHDYWELFEDPEDPGRGRIVGSPPGWEVDLIMKGKVEGYGLEEHYNYFSPGSDTALATALVGAYEKGEPIVAYHWEPSWVMGMYDFTFLEEDGFDQGKWADGYTCITPAMPVTVVVNAELPEKAPDVVAFLENYQTSTALTNYALSYMHEHDAGTDEAALWFLREYEELWSEWVPEEIAGKVREALAQ